MLDYAFELAKNLGARAISCEIDVAQTKHVGQFADKHKMMVGYHGHTATGPPSGKKPSATPSTTGRTSTSAISSADNKTSPVPFLKQHHDRITHIHVKDKTLDDKNVPFGQGDTPIKEALQIIRDNKWPIQATIEFDTGPEGSDRMNEMAKCVSTARTRFSVIPSNGMKVHVEAGPPRDERGGGPTPPEASGEPSTAAAKRGLSLPPAPHNSSSWPR